MEFALLASALLVALYVLWPALKSGREENWEYSENDTPTGRLATRKDVLMGNIADLDFEFAMGKLAEEDYRSLRDNLKRQTLKLMEQLDVIESTETRIGRHAPAATATATATATAAQHCTQCGTGLPARAAFCPSCGTAVQS